MSRSQANPIARRITRLATRKTWQPDRQIERTIRTRRIPFRNPAQLIAEAARALVPEWKPVSLNLYISDTRDNVIKLQFGTDASGTNHFIDIAITRGDIAVIVSYLAAGGRLRHAWVIADPPLDGDDDGGEELPLPPVTDVDDKRRELVQ